MPILDSLKYYNRSGTSNSFSCLKYLILGGRKSFDLLVHIMLYGLGEHPAAPVRQFHFPPALYQTSLGQDVSLNVSWRKSMFSIHIKGFKRHIKRKCTKWELWAALGLAASVQLNAWQCLMHFDECHSLNEMEI